MLLKEVVARRTLKPGLYGCAMCVCLQIRNEQLTNIVRKVQGECEFVLKQASTAAEKQEVLAAQLAKLTKSLEQTEERIKKASQEAKVCSLDVLQPRGLQCRRIQQPTTKLHSITTCARRSLGLGLLKSWSLPQSYAQPL